MRLVVVIGRHRPLSSDLGRLRDGPVSPSAGPRSADGWHLRRGPPQPQPTKARHDGASADRSGACVPRCIPTSLSHAIARRPAQASTASPRRRFLNHQLGKLRSFGAGTAADLGDCLVPGLIALVCFHRGSPSYVVRRSRRRRVLLTRRLRSTG